MAIGKPGESAMAQAEASRPSSNASSSSSAGIRDGGMRTNGGGQASNFGGNGGYSGNSGNFGSGSMATARASDRASVAGYSPASRNFTTPSGGGGYAPGLGAALNAGLGLRTPAMGYSGPKGTFRGLNDAAWVAGGGMIADPAAVAGIRANLGYTPIGIRTNNPGNILDGPFARSQPGYVSGVTSPNGLTYASFTRPDYGVLAKQTLLQDRYYDKRGLDTIGKIIDRYAPVDQNNSAAANAAYKSTLANSLGVKTNTPLTRDQVALMGPSMIKFENAGNPYRTGVEAQRIASGALSSPAVSAPIQTASRAPVQANMGAPLATPARTAAPTGPTPITNEAFAQEAVQRLQAAGVDVQRLQVPQAAPRPQAAQTLASVDRQPPMARPSTVSPGSAMQPLGPAVDVPTLNTYQAPARIGTKVAAVPYDYPRAMPSWAAKSLKTGVNTLATSAPVLGPLNALGSLFGYSLGDSAVWSRNRAMNQVPGSVPRSASSALANYQGRVGGNGRDGGRDNPNTKPSNKPSKPINDVKTPDAVWKQAALDSGYTEAQLKDPEIAALIKQLYDMGFLETNTA